MFTLPPDMIWIETTNCFSLFPRTDAAKMIKKARAEGKTLRKIIGGWKF